MGRGLVGGALVLGAAWLAVASPGAQDASVQELASSWSYSVVERPGVPEVRDSSGVFGETDPKLFGGAIPISGIAGDLSFHPVYLALAVGCGSKPIAWMNDSGFWVICKMSGMSEAEGLKYITPMTTCMGIVGLAATMVGATLFPMT